MVRHKLILPLGMTVILFASWCASQTYTPRGSSGTGIRTQNSAAQSQVVSSGTNYYFTSSGLTMPATFTTAIAAGTRFTWRIGLTKTAAGTGTFQISLYHGLNGTTADTQDVLQTIGTQTAVVDSMTVDIEIVFTSATAYYWSMTPQNKAITATGFGVATGAGGFFSGTVSGLTTTTGSTIWGLGFKATTGTPTIVVPLVIGQAFGVN